MTCLLFARLNLFVTFLQLSAGNLDEFLNYYETLHHDDLKHQIKRRDLYTRNPTERIVEFDAHGKHFKLVLHKNTSVLSSDFKVSVVGQREKRSAEMIDTTIYKGYVDDEPSTSSVSAYWDDDQHFTATISTESETFVVEPSWRHLPESPDYTLISYKDSDMKQNNEKSIWPNQFCGVTSHTMGHGKASETKETLDGAPNLSKDRAKRYAHPACPELQNKACPVLLVADFRFFVEIGGRDAAKTAKYMIGVLDYVDHLFRHQMFGDCGLGFGFVIKKILVHGQPTNIANHYNNDKIFWQKSEELLWSFSSHSEEHISYADFCLVHLFTAHSFTSNVLGISELAQPTKSPTGGLCSGFRKPKRSMNTGWTTFLGGNGRRVVYRQARLVVAHEFGHAWGSGHEFPNSTHCNPKGGKYLMYVYSVTGSQTINEMFSPCSIEAIRDVLVYKAQVCFVKSGESTSLCGNYKWEKGEQCDEGPGGQSCCTNSCLFQKGKVCSDLNQPCCENCQVANASTPCREATAEPCSVLPYCNGNSSHCPAPAAKPDGEPCENQFRGVCSNQKCTSICEYNNKTNCTCDSVELSCRICCRDSPNENDTCKVYRVLNDTMDYGNLSDSSPCPMGLCSNGVCTKVTDTSVKRSWSFIEIRSFSHFVVFMKNNIVGTVIVLSLLLWIPASCTVSYIDRKRAKEAKEATKDLTFISRLIATNDFLVPQNDQSRVKIKMAAGTLERKTTICTRPA